MRNCLFSAHKSRKSFNLPSTLCNKLKSLQKVVDRSFLLKSAKSASLLLKKMYNNQLKFVGFIMKSGK